MLPPCISDTMKDKHPTWILALYGGECYRHSFPHNNDKPPRFILASYGAEYYRHCCFDTNDKHATFIFSVIRSRMLPPFISDFFFPATKFPVRATID